jgi:hypothetical protein
MKRIILITVLVACFTLANATLSVSPTSKTIPSAGKIDTLTVTANVTWTATVDSSWITIISGSAGSNNGIIIYSVNQNNNVALLARVAHITVTPSSGTAQVINISQSTSYKSKPLHGTYIKINSYVGISIPVKEGNLGAKTSPTTFYWLEIDTSVVMNIKQMDAQGLVTLKTTFHLYYDYQSYWQWKPPFDCLWQTTFISPWEDVSDGGWNIVDNYDNLLLNYISTTMNIPMQYLSIYSY